MSTAKYLFPSKDTRKFQDERESKTHELKQANSSAPAVDEYKQVRNAKQRFLSVTMCNRELTLSSALCDRGGGSVLVDGRKGTFSSTTMRIDLTIPAFDPAHRLRKGHVTHCEKELVRPHSQKGARRFKVLISSVPLFHAHWMHMKIGYARVSTDEQSLDLQEDSLRHAGCTSVYTDKGMSGTDFQRPGLHRAIRRLRPGDTLVVWRLDRLGRSLPKLVELVTSLERRTVRFESLTEAISTESPGGTLIFHMMAALAQFERSLISERTKAGMAAAKQRGTILGRRHSLTARQQMQALEMLETQPASTVAKQFNVHPRTLIRLSRASKAQSANESC